MPNAHIIPADLSNVDLLDEVLGPYNYLAFIIPGMGENSTTIYDTASNRFELDPIVQVVWIQDLVPGIIHYFTDNVTGFEDIVDSLEDITIFTVYQGQLKRVILNSEPDATSVMGLNIAYGESLQ